MATITYERVLREAQQSTPEEQRRLREELVSPGEPIQTPPTDRQGAAARAFLDKVDRLAARISAVWQDDTSAVDAVREQRRVL